MENHTSRVFIFSALIYTTLNLSVSDAFLRDVVALGIALSVADATLVDVTTGGPVLAVSADILNFVSTPLGGSYEMTLVFSNTGDEPLTISSLTLTGDFSVVSII
jgi:hypothetical protein